jgi:hypothetical protein
MSRGEQNHHLWRNGRLWWVAFVAIADGVRQVRIRQSLKTDDVEVARVRRDELIQEYERRSGWVVPRRIQARRDSARAEHAAAKVQALNELSSNARLMPPY